jgi:hypothetical protein
LYKHGVGYFARSGRLGAGESARLDFKAEEMNDVLKSLTLEEKGGGKISGLRYDSSESLDKKLGEFPFALGSQQPLSAVLDQLKGARIELKFGAETVAGAIVGARRAPPAQNQPEREQVTMLMDSGEIRNLDLGAVTSLHFSDPALQLQFKDYLSALAQARSKERRSVYIDSTDSKAREISASYMIPTPVWKSSYRLIFGEGGQPTLEGWASVDNTTGDDWSNVRLALVSGRPISFISQLYQPRYMVRPTAELPEEAALAPMVDTGALDEEKTRPSAGIASERLARTTCARTQLPNGHGRAQCDLHRLCYRTRRTVRIPHLGSRHHPQKRIRHAALPPGQDLGATAVDLFRSKFRASTQRRGNHEFHRQDAGWRAHHRLRRGRLRRRSAHGNRQNR